MRRTFSSFLFFVALAAIGVPSKANAEESIEWISRELATRDYKISSYEEDGVYYCSTRDQIIDTEFKDGYALIIFEREAPRFFMEKELSSELLSKLKTIDVGESYSVLCMRSFFRDDWQERYDAEHTVTDRLLNVWKRPKELVKLP